MMRLCLTTLILLMFLCQNLFAQEKGTFVTDAIQKGDQVELTIASDKAFYVGGNVHVLHIGNSTYTHNRQSKIGTRYFMTFFIPQNDYILFSETDAVWMTYGKPVSPTEKIDIKSLALKYPGIFWDLGNFSNQWFKR